MDKQVLKIIEKEDPEVIKNILIDLVQLDKKNGDRILVLYHKY